MPDLDEDMRELDALLRRAAERGAARARPVDFDTVVRRARTRRRNLSAAGAAGLVACVAIGVAVVAGVRGGAAPDPHPGLAAGPAPSAGADPSASLPPVGPDKKVRKIDLGQAQKDEDLRSLITDVGVIAWRPDAGRTVEDVRDSADYFTFLSGDGIRSGAQPQLNDIGSLRSTFPEATTADPAVFTVDSLTMAELQHAAEILSDVPGVRDARVVTVRGMWFRAELQVEREAGHEDDGMGPVIGLPGIQGGSSQAGPGSSTGRSLYTVSVTYVGGGVDQAGLDEIKTELGRPWDAPGDQVTVSPKQIKPE